MRLGGQTRYSAAPCTSSHGRGAASRSATISAARSATASMNSGGNAMVGFGLAVRDGEPTAEGARGVLTARLPQVGLVGLVDFSLLPPRALAVFRAARRGRNPT